MEELRGIEDGGKASGELRIWWGAGRDRAGVKNAGVLVARSIVLANLPGDPQHLIYVIEEEFKRHKHVPSEVRDAVALLKSRLPELVGVWTTFKCSMMAVWGSRTEGGDLYSCRNLDWASNTGINKHKLVTVFRPNDGAIAHATYGFSGIFGALAGSSAQGLSVHEANLEQRVGERKGGPILTPPEHHL